MFNIFNNQNKAVQKEIILNCSMLLDAYAFYRVLDSGMARLNVDTSTQTSFWEINFNEAYRVFYRTALMFAKLIAHDHNDALTHVQNTLKDFVYPEMRMAFADDAPKDNSGYMHYMTCHLLNTLWLLKIKSVGQDRLMQVFENTNREQIATCKELLEILSVPYDEVNENAKTYDFLKYYIFIERYFKLWIREGFIEGLDERHQKEKPKTKAHDIFRKPERHMKPQREPSEIKKGPGFL